MKIIHCADLHLDSKLNANLPVDKAKERRQELLLTFSRLVDYAVKEGVEKIIISGDMFDTKKVLTTTKNAVLRLIKENSNIDFFYLSGNHDEDNFIYSLEDEIPLNLKVFTEEFKTFDFGDFTISGIKLTNDNYITFYNNVKLDQNKINILSLHGQVSKYTVDNPDVINITELKNKNIDYLALGHIHSYQKEKLDDRGVYCYSGCLEGRGFDECGIKGFSLIEIEDGKLNSTFIPFAKRTIYEIEHDITGKTWGQIIKDIKTELSLIKDTSLIKVVLTGEHDLDLEMDLFYLTSILNNDFYFVKIKDESKLKINLNDFALDPSLKGEFIRTVMSDISLSEQEKNDIIMCGINALNGEKL